MTKAGLGHMAASEAADSSGTGVATSLYCAAKAICLRSGNFASDAPAHNLHYSTQAKAALTITRPFHRGDGVSAGGLRREVVLAVLLYCLCSSSLLFLNKVAVSKLGLKPGAIVVVQIFVSTTLCIMLGGVFKVIPIDNAFEARRIRLFFLYVLGFVGSIYSSAMALRRSNVETVIVFRATTPLAVSLLDYFFLGRAAPSIRSTMALVATALSAAAYVATDSQFVVEGFDGYIWCLVYVGIVSFDMTFGKHLVSKSVRTGVWESVFLTNCMALPVLVLFSTSRGELDDLPSKLAALSFARSSLLLASSGVAFLIGYAGWLCRSLVAATTYTLIGTSPLRPQSSMLLAYPYTTTQASVISSAPSFWYLVISVLRGPHVTFGCRLLYFWTSTHPPWASLRSLLALPHLRNTRRHHCGMSPTPMKPPLPASMSRTTRLRALQGPPIPVYLTNVEFQLMTPTPPTRTTLRNAYCRTMIQPSPGRFPLRPHCR